MLAEFTVIGDDVLDNPLLRMPVVSVDDAVGTGTIVGIEALILLPRRVLIGEAGVQTIGQALYPRNLDIQGIVGDNLVANVACAVVQSIEWIDAEGLARVLPSRRAYRTILVVGFGQGVHLECTAKRSIASTAVKTAQLGIGRELQPICKFLVEIDAKVDTLEGVTHGDALIVGQVERYIIGSLVHTATERQVMVLAEGSTKGEVEPIGLQSGIVQTLFRHSDITHPRFWIGGSGVNHVSSFQSIDLRIPELLSSHQTRHNDSLIDSKISRVGYVQLSLVALLGGNQNHTIRATCSIDCCR